MIIGRQEADNACTRSLDIRDPYPRELGSLIRAWVRLGRGLDGGDCRARPSLQATWLIIDHYDNDNDGQRDDNDGGELFFNLALAFVGVDWPSE